MNLPSCSNVFALGSAIAEGRLPPAIIASPDGSVRGIDCLFFPSSFFLNSEAGRYEDYLMVDVWNFLMCRFPDPSGARRRTRLSASRMGGAAAFNKGIKFPAYFRYVVGIFPPLNLRWQDCHGNYRRPLRSGVLELANRLRASSHGPGARFYGIPVRMRSILNPLYSRRNPETLPAVIRNNPVEMLDLYDVQPGLLDMFVAYGGWTSSISALRSRVSCSSPVNAAWR